MRGVMQMVSPIMKNKTALVEAMRGLGPGWHSRVEIAAYMGKNKLNPGELMVLDEMAVRGEIFERQLGPGPRESVFQWTYRIKDESGNE